MTTQSVSLGYIPLTDCALLAIAKARGLFEAEGLDVRLSREASWANIRDKVVSGVLDGAHMLAPMALACALGADGPATPMIAPMALNVNGSSLGVSTSLAVQLAALEGNAAPEVPRTAAALKRLIDKRRVTGERPLTFAVVFPFSIHAYMLRYWLGAAGIDPDRDIRITVVPPPRIAARTMAGEIDGFCVGAPWGGLIEGSGAGAMLLHGAQFWAGAPDKVLGVTSAWAERHPDALQSVMRALLKAAIWADDPANETALTVLLERPDYVNAPRTALGRALSKANPYGLRFQAGDAAYPRQAHALWLLTQMRRWGQISAAPGQEAAARAVYRPDLYRKAAAAIGAAPPRADIDTAPLPRLFDGGAFDPAHLDDYVAGFAVRQRMAPAR
jgi:ABC-type nitrate/sulfonate/bicarbonate transport system substrate-binding protein